MDKICGFFDDYRWLSNFWYSTIMVDGKFWASVEHYYQAMKSLDPADQEWVRLSDTPKIAKERGSKITLRKNWEKIKEEVMLKALMAKFTQCFELREKLLATGDAYLEETNYWGDKYWGVCNGVGKNRLGILLMQVRETLRMDKFYA